MPVSTLSAVFATAGRSAAASAPAADGELLLQFVRSRDEGAFEALVRRLGPMVLGVCRRVSGDAHLAEDAFQAAFVVLARRAADVRPAAAVRGWMYGVAVRTAREARNVSVRRLARETPVPALPDRAEAQTEQPDADVLRILDEEIAGLPERLRAALLLCELEGVPRRRASERLGIPEGTLSSRLAKARKLLADRLRRRGVVAPAAGLTVLAQAVLAPRLVAQTSALLNATAPLSAAVAAISNGVLRTMFLHKLALGSACALLLAVACWAAPDTPSNTPAPEPPKPALFFGQKERLAGDKKPATKAAGPGTILLVREGSYQLLTPDGKKEAEFTPPEKTSGGGHASLSPDGKRVALVVSETTTPAPAGTERDKPWPFKIAVRTLGKPESEKVHDMPAEWLTLCWAADGKRVIVIKYNDRNRAKDFENLLMDPETGKTESLDLPAGVRVLDCGRDGKTFLVEVVEPKVRKRKPALATVGEKKVKELTELQNWPPSSSVARLSPDGTKVLFTDGDPQRKNAHKWGQSHRPYVLDVKTLKREPPADFPENAKACGVAWSPDGKRIAYTWMQLHDELLKKDSITADEAEIETEAFLIVADADGKNAKTVASGKGPFALNMIFGTIDWR